MSKDMLVVLGGSFNPPTVAHAELARLAVEYAQRLPDVNTARAAFVPSSGAYVGRKMAKHGNNAPVFSEKARLEMLQALSKDLPIVIDASEYGDDGKGHTYRTMCRVRDNHPGIDCAFLMGADKLRILPRWRDVEKLLSEFTILVTSRSGDDPESMIAADPRLFKHRNAFRMVPPLDPSGADASSTEARRLAANGDKAGLLRICGLNVAEIVLREMAGMKKERS